EEPGGAHHYRTISYEKALKAIQQLDRLVERELQIEQAKLNNKIEHSYQ
ncbi:phosphohydrolase, partial [Bacillus cereus]|nr:phosphohydrolase [Bacillus cereus]